MRNAGVGEEGECRGRRCGRRGRQLKHKYATESAEQILLTTKTLFGSAEAAQIRNAAIPLGTSQLRREQRQHHSPQLHQGAQHDVTVKRFKARTILLRGEGVSELGAVGADEWD